MQLVNALRDSFDLCASLSTFLKHLLFRLLPGMYLSALHFQFVIFKSAVVETRILENDHCVMKRQYMRLLALIWIIVILCNVVWTKHP